MEYLLEVCVFVVPVMKIDFLFISKSHKIVVSLIMMIDGNKFTIFLFCFFSIFCKKRF